MFNEIFSDVSDKHDVVKLIIGENGLNRLETCFVGGSGHEIEVAKKVGILGVAVTWGFCSKNKLKTFLPDLLINDVQELRSIFDTY